MSRPGTIVFGLTETVSLVVTSSDVEAGLTHARRVAFEMGFPVPVACTTVITEEATSTQVEVWSDITHEEACRWVLGEAHRATLVGAVVTK